MCTMKAAAAAPSEPSPTVIVGPTRTMANDELVLVCPVFGLPGVSQKLRAYNIIRVINIIKLKIYNLILCFIMFCSCCAVCDIRSTDELSGRTTGRL